jgi:hypothetical protein
MGRQPTAPKKFKDGFYIEVCNRGSKQGVKISCPDKNAMLEAIKIYERNKDIIIWGEHHDGKWKSEKILPKRN